MKFLSINFVSVVYYRVYFWTTGHSSDALSRIEVSSSRAGSEVLGLPLAHLTRLPIAPLAGFSGGDPPSEDIWAQSQDSLYRYQRIHHRKCPNTEQSPTQNVIAREVGKYKAEQRNDTEPERRVCSTIDCDLPKNRAEAAEERPRGLIHSGSPAFISYLMRLVPAAGPAGLDDERDRELAMWGAGAFHDRLDDLGRFLDLGFGRLEQQFVMHLQQHPGA